MSLLFKIWKVEGHIMIMLGNYRLYGQLYFRDVELQITAQTDQILKQSEFYCGIKRLHTEVQFSKIYHLFENA